MFKFNATYFGVDEFGMTFLERKLPAIVYVTLNNEEKISRTNFCSKKGEIPYVDFHGKDLQLGLDKEMLRSYFWEHRGACAFSLGEQRHNQSDFKQKKNISQRLNEEISGIFTALIYQGSDDLHKPLTYLFVDTTQATTLLTELDGLKTSFEKTICTYGIDKTFLLSAFEAVEDKDLLSPEEANVGLTDRLDITDKGVVDLSIVPFSNCEGNKLAKTFIKESYESIFNRFSYIRAKKQGLLNSPYDEPNLREFMRQRLYLKSGLGF